MIECGGETAIPIQSSGDAEDSNPVKRRCGRFQSSQDSEGDSSLSSQSSLSPELDSEGDQSSGDVVDSNPARTAMAIPVYPANRRCVQN